MARHVNDKEEVRKKSLFIGEVPVMANNAASASVVNGTYSAGLSLTGQLNYYGSMGYTIINTGGAFGVTTETKPIDPDLNKPYSRAALRKLEKLAAGPLDDEAPEDESKFMDWLNSD
jgi:hypothetical protein